MVKVAVAIVVDRGGVDRAFVSGAVVDQPIAIGDDIADISASIGVSRQAPGVLELEALIASADEALYMAKSLGRNQVIAASVRLNQDHQRSH